MNYSAWKEMTIDISHVLLDYDNPRVFVENPTQENILRFLVSEEGSIDLARQINQNKGLPPAEKPVVILENGKFVVVEGNRRVSACKILYDRSLLSKRDADKVPKIDKDMKMYLKNFPVVLAPSRDAAEPFITMRHAGEKGIKRWSTISTTKRYINRFRKGESVNQISKVLGETPSNVRKGIRFFVFLEFVRNELSWTEEEKRNLEIFKMETTKLDRFLPFSKRAKEILKIDFAEGEIVTTALPERNFKEAIQLIIKRIYLYNEIDTRSSLDDVFNSEVISICEKECEEFDVPGGAEGGSTGGAEGGSTGGAEGGSTGGAEGGSTGGAEGGSTGGAEGGSTGGAEGGSTGGAEGGSTGGKEGGSTGGAERGSTGRNGRSAMDAEKYLYLPKAYPFSNKYKNNKKINLLAKELKSVKYKENRMGTMYLIRSLLETYIHEYIDYFVSLEDREFRMKGIARERSKRTQTLREILYSNIKVHLKQVFPVFHEEIELIEVAFTENNSTAATKIINFYIHSQTQVPDFHELLDAWKKVSQILNCLDQILFDMNTRRS